jgi:hypothetical protein
MPQNRMAYNIKRKNRGFFLNPKGERKVIYEECVRSIDKQLVTENGAFLWLSIGDMQSKAAKIKAQNKML